MLSLSTPNFTTGVLKQYLRSLAGMNQGDRADYVGRAEFSYNVATNSATKGSSFMVVAHLSIRTA